MAIDIEALARNQAKLIEKFKLLSSQLDSAKKTISSQGSLIEKLHDRVKYLESQDGGMATKNLMDIIRKAKQS